MLAPVAFGDIRSHTLTRPGVRCQDSTRTERGESGRMSIGARTAPSRTSAKASRMRAVYRTVGRIIRGTLDKSDAVALFFLLVYAMGDAWPREGPRHLLLIVLAL